MLIFRVYFLYGKSHLGTINADIVTLKNFRKTIDNPLPPFREINDYLYVVSGKPPHKLNINNEQGFNEHRILITNDCYTWMKLIK
ncbi:unnamed protein product [Rotaria sp. Silwood2]|nr:unnamed protein product [Rotaria sp. Silwood2]CAF4606358.1 unnamed protein product [Rotaria sp. Silwood2]